MVYMFICLAFSKVSAMEKLPSPSQSPARATCLSYEPTVVELTGRIAQKTFADAQARPETEWLLNLSLPVCVNEDTKEPDLNSAQKDIRAIQLVFLDHKMYAKYQSLLGKRVTAKGTLFAGITAHHHTPVLLTVSTLRIAE
jgi:hypothetical protein